MKNIVVMSVAIVVLVAIAVGLYFLYTVKSSVVVTPPIVGAQSPKDATYMIEGQPVTLVNGVSVVPAAPGSASKITTQYFGNEVVHDFNGDGRPDTAFLLTQNTGGSGTFYYVVVALNTVNGYIGSDGVLLGDRIAPQTTEISQVKNSNVIVVNYAVRNAGEPFTTQPSVAKSMSVLLDPQTMKLRDVNISVL